MQRQTSYSGFMPRAIAVTLLTSPYSKTAGFRKRCFRAMEKVCEPVSRSTQLDISAPKTGEQRLDARLKKATAAQLQKWSKRTLARGNRLQDLLFGCIQDDAATFKLLKQQIAAHDVLCEAIKIELDNRAQRGKLKIL